MAGDNGSGWLADLDFFVGDKASGAVGSASGGTGFTLSHDEAVVLLRRTEAVVRMLNSMVIGVDREHQVMTPSNDPASNDTTSTMNLVAKYGAGHVKRELAYMAELAKRLRDSLGITEKTDDEAGRDVGRSGSGGGVF